MTGKTLAMRILLAALQDSGYHLGQADMAQVKILVWACTKSLKAGATWSKADIADFACGEVSDQKRIAAAKPHGLLVDDALSEVMDTMK